MMHITVALPDEVAQRYYTASEKLDQALQLGTKPDPQTLMRFMLAGFSADDIAEHFDGAPMPDETDTWVFSPGFEDAP
jgi:hypothetical protein